MRSNGTLNDVYGGGTAEKLINDVLGGGTAEKLLKSRTLNGALMRYFKWCLEVWTAEIS